MIPETPDAFSRLNGTKRTHALFYAYIPSTKCQNQNQSEHKYLPVQLSQTHKHVKTLQER